MQYPKRAQARKKPSSRQSPVEAKAIYARILAEYTDPVDGTQCAWCGEIIPGQPAMHHIIGGRGGRKTTLDNVVPVHHQGARNSRNIDCHEQIEQHGHPLADAFPYFKDIHEG